MGSKEQNAGPDLPGVEKIETIARGIWQEAGRVLLCRQRPSTAQPEAGKDYWYLPGGHVDPGEQLTTALLREFREETGITGLHTGGCMLAEEQLFVQNSKRGPKPRHEYTFVFHVEHPHWPIADDGSPEPVPAAEPQLEFAWVEPAALIEMDIRPATTKAFLLSGSSGGAGTPTLFVSHSPHTT